MNEEQIKKLTRIIIGIEKLSAFSENEIEELEKRSSQKNNFVTIT